MKNEDGLMLVCLNIGNLKTTIVETERGDCFEDQDLCSYKFPETIDMSNDNLNEWSKKHLSVIFDGNLDDPQKFVRITLIGLSGPSSTKYSTEGLTLSDVAVYLNVISDGSDLDEESVEDIFHLVVPVIETNGNAGRFTDWQDYNVEFIDELPDNFKKLNGEWTEE